jgi:hypothetical protein
VQQRVDERLVRDPRGSARTDEVGPGVHRSDDRGDVLAGEQFQLGAAGDDDPARELR